MSKEFSPQRYANQISSLLNSVLGADRFPVNVRDVAVEYSRNKFPDDPITDIIGDDLPGFEGALCPAQNGKKGWGILYNSSIKSLGRINFTLAHEFGHYLLHRSKYPDGIYCTDADMRTWDSINRQIESEANEFAASLLMPLDDFRRRVDARQVADFEILGDCSNHYEVSLQAATLRWLQYTTRRAILVVANEGFILWARSSDPALKTGAFFRTANVPPVSIPQQSLAAQREQIVGHRATESFDSGVWFDEPCHECVLFSDQYDFSMSLLTLPSTGANIESLDGEPVEDSYERMMKRI